MTPRHDPRVHSARSSSRAAARPAVVVEPLEQRLVFSTITVTTLADTADANDGVTSLREAITAANAGPSGTINFAPGLGGPIDLTGPLPRLNGVTIQGPGADRVDVRRAIGASGFSIFVTPGSHVTLSGLTISGGEG